MYYDNVAIGGYISEVQANTGKMGENHPINKYATVYIKTQRCQAFIFHFENNIDII